MTRVRLLVARAFWPFGFPDDLRDGGEDAARRDGEEAGEMALRLDRTDLASAALDAVAGTYLATGNYGGQQRVIERRLALVPKLHDPFELGDLYAVAAWGEFHVGRYEACLNLADEGVLQALGTPGVTLHALSWRILALIRLGRWDEAVAALARLNEVLGDRWDDPPGFALRAFGAAAYLLDAHGQPRGGRPISRRRHPREPAGGACWAPSRWVGEPLARRGEFERSRTVLENRTSPSGRQNAGLILEARCELISESADWDEADKL